MSFSLPFLLLSTGGTRPPLLWSTPLCYFPSLNKKKKNHFHLSGFSKRMQKNSFQLKSSIVAFLRSFEASSSEIELKKAAKRKSYPLNICSWAASAFITSFVTFQFQSKTFLRSSSFCSIIGVGRKLVQKLPGAFPHRFFRAARACVSLPQGWDYSPVRRALCVCLSAERRWRKIDLSALRPRAPSLIPDSPPRPCGSLTCGALAVEAVDLVDTLAAVEAGAVGTLVRIDLTEFPLVTWPISQRETGGRCSDGLKLSKLLKKRQL